MAAPFKPFTDTPIGYVDNDGSPVAKMKPTLSDDQLKRLYGLMVLCRAIDDRGYIMVRQGRAGFLAQTAGQEASQIGSAFFLEKRDWIFPSHRELGAALTKGMTPGQLLAHVLGKDLDPAKGRNMPSHYGDGELHIVSPSSTVGNKTPAAVGVAMAAHIKKSGEVSMCYIGDGATSEGDTLAAFNLAGVFKSPVIFAVQNNQYAISIDAKHQTASRTFAEKAAAFGFDGYLVDGNDVVACAEITKFAIDRARAGEGPTLIEFLTYRYGPHSSADDDSRYRKKEELELWRNTRDPITRMKKYLTRQGLWDDAAEAKLQDEVKAAVEKGLAEAEASPLPAPETVFDHVYATLLPHQIEEKIEIFGHA
ncbi:MAG: thiamine pyrophosphate-dependent dehydrogenase E1 component subunit alpha [bacterium]|nr:thiamine pyrophosphate-dependent dehydrogenase E1 component subunit alpha [bacterium]